MFKKIKKFFHTKNGVEQKEINKQLLITFVSVFLTVISVIGVSFAAFVWSDNSEKEQKLVVGNVSLSISSDSEPLGSGLNYPVNDSDVDKLEPYTFTITNNGSLATNYTLKLVDDTAAITSDGCADNQIDKNYIFANVNGATAISNTSLTNLMSNTIDTGVLVPGQTKTYHLRLWIEQSAPNSVIGGHFHGKIQLETSQLEGAEPTYDVVASTSVAIADSEIKTGAKSFPIKVTNTSNEHKTITIKLTDINFRWGLYNADTDKGVSFGTFKYSESGKDEIIYKDMVIDAGADDKNYILRIWVHDDAAEQNYMIGQSFLAKISVTSETVEYTPESCFTFNNGIITDYDATTCGTDVVIPKTIGGVTVTAINSLDVNYSGKGLTSVIIPDTVTTLGASSLRGNNLTHLTIPENVTKIEQFVAYQNNNLTSLILPESVASTMYETFGHNLTTVVVPGSVKLLGGATFSGQTNLTDVILMDGIEEIGSDIYNMGMKGSTFKNTSLTSIEIPSSVTKIYKDSFANNSNLTEIVVRGKTSLIDFTDSTGLTTEGGLPEGVNIIFRP